MEQQPQPTPTPETAPQWYGAETNKPIVESKGFKSVDDVFKWGQNAESLIGADRAGRTVILPKDENDKDGMTAFRAKIGVPAKAEDYGLPVPEGSDGEFAKVAATWMHELGVPQKAGQALGAKWNEYFAKAVEAHDKQIAAAQEAEVEALRNEWGEDFDARAELGRRFASEMGLTDDELNKLEGALGSKRFLSAFYEGGIKLAEPKPGGGSGGQNRFGASGQSQAVKDLEALNLRRIAGTISDKDFAAEAERLGRIAYPDRAA